MEIKKCKCCFPFQCGEIQLKMSKWEYTKLKMALKYSTILKPDANHAVKETGGKD